MKQSAFDAFYIKTPEPLAPASDSFRDLVAAYFKAYPQTWVDGRELARIGGTYAWRTRVSDCRRQLGMTIENRTRRVPSADGEGFFVISEYRFIP